LLGAEDWPLRVVIAVTSSGAKAVKSSEGMRLSAETSPFYQAWVASTPDDFAAAEQAVEARDFPALAELSEHSSLKMHGLMLSSRPGLLYWNPTTLACLQRVRELQADGVTVFATMDAGPQVKAICPPASEAAVMAALGTVPGVLQLLSSGLGRGAWVAR
jgi:diphosphomevalonate decarboxylase